MEMSVWLLKTAALPLGKKDPILTGKDVVSLRVGDLSEDSLQKRPKMQRACRKRDSHFEVRRNRCVIQITNEADVQSKHNCI